MGKLFTDPIFRNALITATAMAVACALLSVLVVLRRWAFIGEGVSHAGFGGVGTAWLLSLAIPALGSESAAYSVAVVFCVAMALAIGWVSRRDLLHADAAIGIVLVASLAWGVVALSLYNHAKPGGAPASTGWEFYLLGEIGAVSRQSMISGVCISAAVVVIMLALGKEILSYGMDPDLAEVSGVRTAFIHYLLMTMVALVIVVGMRLVGYLLVTALLVLPGATALVLTQRLGRVIAVAVIVSLIGTIGGLAMRARWSFLNTGPAMVLLLFGEFVLAYGIALMTHRRSS
jgi:ABC-type Mn2+/Zn2+ transport system permease subunit